MDAYIALQLHRIRAGELQAEARRDRLVRTLKEHRSQQQTAVVGARTPCDACAT
jgi:hypothetical protein